MISLFLQIRNKFLFPPPCAVDDNVYHFEVGSLPQGSVCLFGGEYWITFKTLVFPPETCTVPKPKSTGKQYVNPECH